jgi:hypothetical protein
LDWTASRTATSYNVYRSTSSGNETLLATALMTTSYIDDTVVNGMTYFYKVSAVNSSAESVLSREVSATPTGETTTGVNSSANPTVYGQAATFTATVTSGGNPVTAGTVTFHEGSTILASAVPLDSSGRARFTTATLSAAASPHAITADYSGTTQYATSSGTVSQSVDRAPLTIRADDNSKVAGDPVPTLTASYSGFVNGDTPDSLTTPVILTTYTGDTAGSYPIVASGATSPDYSITFVDGTLTVTPAAAAFLVLSGPSSATAGEPFTVTVTAYDAFGNQATGYLGTVTFSSTDQAAGLPGDYTFQPGDQGSQSFLVTLETPGTRRVTVTDTLDPTVTGYLDVTL